jgi:hypothetical protein
MGKSSNHTTTTTHVLFLFFFFSSTSKKPHATAARREYIIRNMMREMKKKAAKDKLAIALSHLETTGRFINNMWAKIQKRMEVVFPLTIYSHMHRRLHYIVKEKEKENRQLAELVHSRIFENRHKAEVFIDYG